MNVIQNKNSTRNNRLMRNIMRTKNNRMKNIMRTRQRERERERERENLEFTLVCCEDTKKVIRMKR